MRLMPSKENHSFNTQFLVGKSSEIGHFLWQFSSPKNLMGFFYLSSWADSSSWDTDLSIFHLAAGLCVLLTAPLLRSSDEWHIPSSLKWGTTQICSLPPAVSQRHLHNKSIIPFLELDVLKMLGRDVVTGAMFFWGPSFFLLISHPTWCLYSNFNQKNQLSNRAGLAH